MGWVVIIAVALLMAAGGILWAFVSTVFMIATSLNIPYVIIAPALLVLFMIACVVVIIIRRPTANT